MSRRVRWSCLGGVLAAGLGTVVAGCQPASGPVATKSTPPAKVEKLPGEADLTTIHLSDEAVARLRIGTAAVARRPVRRITVYGGEIMVPPGHAVAVSAPVSGTVLAPVTGRSPGPGTSVRKDQEVFRLIPLLSPEARATLATTHVEAQGQVDQAEKQLAQARIQLDRTQRLRQQNLAGTGAIADAQAQYDIAESTLKAATARRDAFDRTIRGIESGDSLDPIPIHAEVDGSIKQVHVLPGQSVAAGAGLFDMEELDPVWVRVPIYVGDRRALALGDPVQIGDLAGRPDEPTVPGTPVDAPPSGDPLAATVHLFYQVANPQQVFWPGQRVSVAIRRTGPAEGLVVPREALLHDFQGGLWVYVQTAPGTYARRRVRLDHVDGDQAVLAAGPEPGALVVTTGAAELFGTEFGGGK